MKIVYISPRYHTNQNGIISGWLSDGDEVLFLAQYSFGVEDHTLITPHIMGYAKWFERVDRFYVNKLKKNDPFARDRRLRWGVPPLGKIRDELLKFGPDLVILRERNLYTMGCYRLCKKLGLKTIMWNLSPVYAEPSYFKDDIPHRLVRRLTPLFRFTPVRQTGIDMSGKVADVYSYFAPFVVEPSCKPEDHVYFRDGKINIFEIGKYQDRKNHFLMLNAFAELKKKYPDIYLTIAGECSDSFQEDYHARLSKKVGDLGLSDCVKLLKNVPKKEIREIYMNSDIYVLTSTGEPASITVIEAMSNSVPAISGTDNGTADYVKQGVTGYVFEDCDEEDLKAKLSLILENARETIPAMGRAAYESIKEDFGFRAYKSTIEKILRDREEYQKAGKPFGRKP